MFIVNPDHRLTNLENSTPPLSLRRKILSSLILVSYLFSFVLSPVYASAAEVLPPQPSRFQLYQKDFASEPLLRPHFYTPVSQSADQKTRPDFTISVHDISDDSQRCFSLLLTQKDQLLSRFYVDPHLAWKDRESLVPIIGPDSLLQGWSWDLRVYNLPSVQMRTDGAIILDQETAQQQQRNIKIIAPAVHLGTYSAQCMCLQSPEVVIHGAVDIEQLEVSSQTPKPSTLIVGDKASLRLRDLGFQGSLVNLGTLLFERANGGKNPLLRLRGSSFCNYGTITNDIDLRLAELTLFENFGHISTQSLAVGTWQFLNHKTISANTIHILTQHQFMNDVDASIVGKSNVQIVNLGESSNQGLLKGTSAYIAGKNSTGNGSIVAERLRFLTTLWDGQGYFKAADLEFSFQRLLSKGGSAAFEGSKVSLSSQGNNGLLTLTFKGDVIDADLAKTNLKVDGLDFTQRSSFKAKNLAIKALASDSGEIDWQATQKLELLPELIQFSTNTALKAHILFFQAMKGLKSLDIDVHTLAGKTIHADSLNLAFATIGLNPAQQRIFEAIQRIPGNTLVAGDDIPTFNLSVSSHVDNIMELSRCERFVLLNALENMLTEVQKQLLDLQEVHDQRLRIAEAHKQKLYDSFASERKILAIAPDLPTSAFLEILPPSGQEIYLRRHGQFKDLSDECLFIRQQMERNTQKIQAIDVLMQTVFTSKQGSFSNSTTVEDAEDIDTLYQYIAVHDLNITHRDELFENRGHLQGQSVSIKGAPVHNKGIIAAKKKIQSEKGFLNAEEGVVDASLLEVIALDQSLTNAGQMIVKALRGVRRLQNTGHLEILHKGLRLQFFHNSGYANLGAGEWFFEEFSNAAEAVCKLGKVTEVMEYQNDGALYTEQRLKIHGSPQSGLGQLVIDKQAVWYFLPGHIAAPAPATPSLFLEGIRDAVLLGATLYDEEAYLDNVSKEHAVAGFLGFLSFSPEHTQRLLQDVSLEETRIQWTRVLARLGHPGDAIAIMQLLHDAKGQLWEHQDIQIGTKTLKEYFSIADVIQAIDKAILNLLMGAWGLDYLKSISSNNSTLLHSVAQGVGESFYQQQQSIQQLYKEGFGFIATNFMKNRGLGKLLLQPHYMGIIKQTSAGYYMAQDHDSEAAQLRFHPGTQTGDLVQALQQAEIFAESVQVNYDADFMNTEELNLTFPISLRTKKFWNKHKILGGLTLLCDEFSNGIDNDHFGEMAATQGAIDVYSQGKIDNRFGRIFSEQDGAFETLSGNLFIGSMKEILVQHKPQGNMVPEPKPGSTANVLTSSKYLKKTFNGAFISSNGRVKAAGYFGDVFVDYGEIFANSHLEVFAQLIRSISGSIRSRQNLYFYGDKYLCSRPEQGAYSAFSNPSYTHITYYLECADAPETAALGDIYFDVLVVRNEYGNITAGKGIYKLGDLIAGYGKSYSGGFDLHSRNQTYTELEDGRRWYTHAGRVPATPALLRVGEDIVVQGPDAVTITGNMSAGGKIHVDVNSILTRCIGNTRASPSENFLIIDLHEVAKSQAGGFFSIQDSGQVDSLYPITSRFSWKTLDVAAIGDRRESAISETAFEFALQKALAESVGHLSFEEQSGMALQEYLFRNGHDNGMAMSLDELVAKATKPLVAMVARQVQQTMFNIPHLLVPAKFINPYQFSGDVYGNEVRLLTSGDQEHDSSRIVAKKALEARAKGKKKRYTGKYTEVSYGPSSVTTTEKANPQQQFICEEGPLTSVSIQDYQEIGVASSAAGKMMRGSEKGNASFKALELQRRTISTDKESSGFLGLGTTTTLTISEASEFLPNQAASGMNSNIIGENITQVGVEEHAAHALTYTSESLALAAAVGVNRTQTTSTTKGMFSKHTTKSIMEMPSFVRNILNAHTIRFEGQNNASIAGTAIHADTIEDQSRKGAKFGPTIGKMRYEMSTSSRTPLSSSNCGTRGGQELMAPTSLNVRRIVRSASFDDLSSPGEMEFVSCVWQDRDRVEIIGRYHESVYILRKWQESWAHHHQVIPNGAIQVMAVAVSLATQGVGTSFFTTAFGSGAGVTMGSAGLKYLICAAATSFAQTGDLESTVKNLASNQSLRGLAISIASAGLTHKLGEVLEIPLETKSLELMDHLKTEGLQAGVSTAMNLALSNEDAGDILRRGALSFAGSVAGSYGAAHIGDWYKETNHQETYTLHKVLHSLNGGAMGFVMNGTAEGFISGAIGAAVAETILEARNDYLAEKAITRMEEAKKDGTLSNPEKIKEINAAVKEDLASELRTAQLSSAAIAALLGQDATLASHIGGVAGTHNWEPTIGTVITLGLAAWGAYEVYDTYRTHGPEAAIQQLVVMGIVTIATAGTATIAYKIGGAVYPSAAAAWSALISNYPKYGQVIAKITGSKAAQTLGKAKELYGAANEKFAATVEKVGWKSSQTKVMPKAAEAEDALTASRFQSVSGNINETPITWTAPTGTGQTYKIWQRNDIDWNHVRTAGPKTYIGKTNAEAARAGCAPQLPDGHFSTLHHIAQNNRGPLVEASRRYHGVDRRVAGHDTIHSLYGKKVAHPTNPVDHYIFGKETAAYWRGRVANDFK